MGIEVVAAGIIINIQKDKILLIKRQDSLWGESWSIPGGHIEDGERVEEALIRELKEELDLDIAGYEFIFYDEFSPPGSKRSFISLNFAVFASEKIRPNEEIKDARWFDISSINEIDHKIPEKGLDFINRVCRNC